MVRCLLLIVPYLGFNILVHCLGVTACIYTHCGPMNKGLCSETKRPVGSNFLDWGWATFKLIINFKLYATVIIIMSQ